MPAATVRGAFVPAEESKWCETVAEQTHNSTFVSTRRNKHRHTRAETHWPRQLATARPWLTKVKPRGYNVALCTVVSKAPVLWQQWLKRREGGDNMATISVKRQHSNAKEGWATFPPLRHPPSLSWASFNRTPVWRGSTYRQHGPTSSPLPPSKPPCFFFFFFLRRHN